jgi:hypothetical protein
MKTTDIISGQNDDSIERPKISGEITTALALPVDIIFSAHLLIVVNAHLVATFGDNPISMTSLDKREAFRFLQRVTCFTRFLLARNPSCPDTIVSATSHTVHVFQTVNRM